MHSKSERYFAKLFESCLQSQNPTSVSHLNVSDSIPDILQTLNQTKPIILNKSQEANTAGAANVIVNELSDMEADLVDLNSPDHGHGQPRIQVCLD